MRIRGTSRWLVATLLVLGACSTSSTATTAAPDVPGTVPTAPVTTTALLPTTTTSSPATTTTKAAVEILLPNNDVDDPVEAIVAILEYVSYLHTVPDEGRDYLDLVYLESCGCYNAVLGSLNGYFEAGWVQDDQGIQVHEALVTETYDNGNALLQVKESWFPQYIVTASGTRERLERDEYQNDVSLVGMERGSDGRWRVAVIGLLGETVESTRP